MKPAPTKYSTAKTSTNQRIGKWHEENKELRLKALEVVEKAKDLPHLKNKPIKYLLKR